MRMPTASSPSTRFSRLRPCAVCAKVKERGHLHGAFTIIRRGIAWWRFHERNRRRTVFVAKDKTIVPTFRFICVFCEQHFCLRVICRCKTKQFSEVTHQMNFRTKRSSRGFRTRNSFPQSLYFYQRFLFCIRYDFVVVFCCLVEFRVVFFLQFKRYSLHQRR